MTRKKTPPPAYIVISYGMNEWAVLDTRCNDVFAKCPYHQNAVEIAHRMNEAKP
jgi:hypothetical protein